MGLNQWRLMARPPFSAHYLMIDANHARRLTRTDGVHQLDFDRLQGVRDRAAFVQGVNDPPSEPRQRPTPELTVAN